MSSVEQTQAQSPQHKESPQVPEAIPTAEGQGGSPNLDEDAKLALKLTTIIENANDRVKPLLSTMGHHFKKAENDQKQDCLDEDALINAVQPLLEEASAILRETQGAIKALDPDGTIANRAVGRAKDHEATKEERRLAEALAVLTGEVTKATDDAKDKIANMPKAKRDLGPLVAAMTEPLFQIVSGVGLLLNGVLSLLGNLLDGLGLGGLVRGVLTGLGLEKLLRGLGLPGLYGKENKK